MPAVYFTREHEWISVDGTEATVGITAFAASQLGDIVFVEMPEPARVVEAGKEAAVVESVKAASEVYSPVSGTVSENNEELNVNPALVNEDAEGEGWFFRLTLSNEAELSSLMDRAAYEAFVAEQHQG